MWAAVVEEWGERSVPRQPPLSPVALYSLEYVFDRDVT